MAWRSLTALAALALALAAASCATAPPPGSPQTPPQSAGTTPDTTADTRPPAPAPTPAPTPPRTWSEEPVIDVGITWDLDTLTLAPVSNAVIQIERSDSASADAPTGSERLRVQRAGTGRYIVRAGSAAPREVARLAAGDTLMLVSAATRGRGKDVTPDPAFRTVFRGKTWRGYPRVFVNDKGKLTVALRLPLETYLLGVVPGEIGGLAPALIEAGRAQAIAARSYTLYYYGRRGPQGFDLYGTVEDQVYGSVESEKPLATKCVETTRAQIARSAGQPIRANYYSTCGGITADVWEGWPAQDFPYLKSTRDRGPSADWCASSPVYRWKEEWTASDFLATIQRYAPPEGIELPGTAMKELIDVTVESRSRSGRVWQLKVRTDAGDVMIGAHVLRRVLRRPGAAAPILRSNLFKIGVRRDPATRKARAVVASGAGFGHGVGLCQTGALGMARAGRKGEQILGHYYPGAELRRLY